VREKEGVCVKRFSQDLFADFSLTGKQKHFTNIRPTSYDVTLFGVGSELLVDLLTYNEKSQVRTDFPKMGYNYVSKSQSTF
jgi:hypothetical protein